MRLREIAKLNALNEVKAPKMTAMQRRLTNRSETPLLNRRTNLVDVMLVATKAKMNCKEDMNQADINKHRRQREK